MRSPPISTPLRRAALFEEIVALGSQTWMSGTDPEAFAALGRIGPNFIASRRAASTPVG